MVEKTLFEIRRVPVGLDWNRLIAWITDQRTHLGAHVVTSGHGNLQSILGFRILLCQFPEPRDNVTASGLERAAERRDKIRSRRREEI